MRHVTEWLIGVLIGILMLLVPSVWLRANGDGTPVYTISDAERLQVSQLEASMWRARYATEAAQSQIQQALAALRTKCEGSGGAFAVDLNQPASCTCGPPARDVSPASATEPNQTKVPEAQ